jgi:hypothetical protein
MGLISMLIIFICIIPFMLTRNVLGGFGIKPSVYLKIKRGYAKGSTAKPQEPRISFPSFRFCVSASTLRRQRSS